MTLLIPAKVLLHVWSYDFYDMTLSTGKQRRHMIIIIIELIKKKKKKLCFCLSQNRSKDTLQQEYVKFQVYQVPIFLVALTHKQCRQAKYRVTLLKRQNERERERERQRDRDRQTDRQTEREFVVDSGGKISQF